MNWTPLTTEDQLSRIIEKSVTVPQVIFKHSTRCGTSGMVLTRLERSHPPENIDFNFLDLLSHKNISRKIAEYFKVCHESPQVLLIKNRECIYDESHLGIRMDELAEQVI